MQERLGDICAWLDDGDDTASGGASGCEPVSEVDRS
jgi:hypothetical protein